jgi:LysM repeat protein
MRTRWLLLPAALFPVFLSSCGNTTGSGTTGTGPFDANGNYVESWADSPSKWKKGSRGSSDASPDQAEIVNIQAPLMGNHPAAAVAPTKTYTPPPVTPVAQVPIVKPSPSSQTKVLAQTKRPTVHEDDDEEDTPKGKGKDKGKADAVAKNAKGKPKTAVASNTTSGKTKGTSASKTPAKTKPAAVVVKPKPKPAASNRYAVRQGDSLYAIAKRYGTTAAAIQKANGLSGTMIHPGQTLVVPH